MAQQVDMLRGKAAAPLRGKHTVFCQCWKACQWLGTMPIVIWSLINSSPSTCSIRTCRRARHRSVKKMVCGLTTTPAEVTRGGSPRVAPLPALAALATATCLYNQWTVHTFLEGGYQTGVISPTPKIFEGPASEQTKYMTKRRYCRKGGGRRGRGGQLSRLRERR